MSVTPIVNKIEILQKHSQKAKEALDEVPKLIEQFRRSVIKSACTGNLTKDWRNKNTNTTSANKLLNQIDQNRTKQYQENCLTAKQENKKKPKKDIPELLIAKSKINSNWAVTKIENISECLDKFRKPIKRDDRKNRPGNIPYYGANGLVDTIGDYIFDEDLVLVVEDETFIGRQKPFSYIVRGKSWVNNHAHVLRPLGGITVEYLNILLAYYDFIPLTSGSTGRRKLTQFSLRQANLEIAPLEEQYEIISRVKTLLDRVETVGKIYFQCAEKLDMLDASTLAKAFRGELISSNDSENTSSCTINKKDFSQEKFEF